MADNPFPLNIPEKQDSWEKLQLLMNIDPSLKVSADEFNKILAALSYLYLANGNTENYLGTYETYSQFINDHPTGKEKQFAFSEKNQAGDSGTFKYTWSVADEEWVEVAINVSVDQIQAIINAMQEQVNGISSGYQGPIEIADTPTEDGIYTPTEAGTYTNAGNLVYAPEGADEGKVVHFIKTGSSWVKQLVDLNFKKSQLIKKGYEQENIDRPDLDALYGSIIEINEDGYILNDLSNKLIIVDSFDRPDIDFAIIDNEGYLLSIIKNNEQIQVLEGNDLKFIKTPDQSEMPAPSVDVSALYDDYDAIRNNLPKPGYITKSIFGQSSVGGYDIERWDYVPENPTNKIIVLGGVHGSEKVFPVALKKAMEYFVNNWGDNPLMEWVRFNTHIIFIPLINPFGYNQSGRRVNETEPFECNWTRSGSTIIIEIVPANFPSSDILTAENYITDGCVGKTYVSLINSSDTGSIPNNSYKVVSKVDSLNFTIEGFDTGASSGTIDLYVQTDINRNFDSTNPTWDSYTPSNTLTQYPNDIVGAPNDNKGSKPYSTQEAKLLKELFENNSDASAVLSFHNGAGRYKLYKPSGVNSEITDDVQMKVSSLSSFDAETASTDVYNNIPTYVFQTYGMAGYDPEFESYGSGSIEQHTEAVRWAINLIMNLSKNL